MAKKTTNMPVNIADWMSPSMRQLSPDVRGLWIDLQCYMWDSSERGVMLRSDQTPYTKDEIIELIGVDISGSGAWLDLIIDAGLCAIRSDGAYYSVRMVRDEEISIKRRKAGKRGGESTKERIFSKVTTANVKVVKPHDDIVVGDVLPISPPKSHIITKKYKYADYVSLTTDEYSKLCVEYQEEAAKAMIDILNAYKGSSGKRYKSDYLAIKNWVVNRYYEEINRHGTKNYRTTDEPPRKASESDYHDTL